MNWWKNSARIAGELTLTDWLRLVEAWLTLLWFYIAIRTTTFERLNPPLQEMTFHPSRMNFALHLQRLVHLASRLHLFPMTCLPRALTLRLMLLRRQIPAAVQIGVTRTPQGIHAHAWLEVNGEQVGEAEDVTERFQRFG